MLSTEYFGCLDIRCFNSQLGDTSQRFHHLLCPRLHCFNAGIMTRAVCIKLLFVCGHIFKILLDLWDSDGTIWPWGKMMDTMHKISRYDMIRYTVPKRSAVCNGQQSKINAAFSLTPSKPNWGQLSRNMLCKTNARDIYSTDNCHKLTVRTRQT